MSALGHKQTSAPSRSGPARGCGNSCQPRHLYPSLDPSFANAFRTSDWDRPNCRAILDGEMPALKAARTAFNFPCVKGTAMASTLRLREFSAGTGGFLPRRCCSASAAESNRSRSWSSSRLIALGRSFGRTRRGEGGVSTSVVVGEVGGFADGEDRSRVDALENRSGVVDRSLDLPTSGSCRHRHGPAMGSMPYVVPNGTSEIQHCEFICLSTTCGFWVV